MICSFFDWIKNSFLNIYNLIKNFFTGSKDKDSKFDTIFVDLEAGKFKRDETMDSHTQEKTEVEPYSDSNDDKELVLEVSDELGGYGQSPDESLKGDYSSGPEEPIDEQDLDDEGDESDVENDEENKEDEIDETGKMPESLDISDIDVSDEIGSDLPYYEDHENEETDIGTSEIPEKSPEDFVTCPATGKTYPKTDGVCPVSEHKTPEQTDHSEIVEVEGVDVENIEMALASSEEEEEIEIPKGDGDSEESKSKKGKKSLTQKLKWEPKASIPKYAMVINSKLNMDDIQKTSITTKGKAEKLAQVQTEINQSKAKVIKDLFRKELDDKKTADQNARAKIVEKERARVAEAKKKKELAAEKLRKEASERYRKEKELKEKEKLELETKRREFNKAKVEAIRSSKF